MERWVIADELTTDLEDVHQVVVRVVAGDVTITPGERSRVEVRRQSGGDVHVELRDDVSTVSGDVAVRTTSEPNLHVEATSVSGRLTTDFGIGWESRPGRKHLDETIGTGGARLWVKTVSGDLRVLRGRAAA